MRHRLGTAEHVRHAQGDDVKTVAEQCDVGIGFVPEELAVPDPRLAGCGLFGDDHAGCLADDRKLIAVEAVPVRLLAGKRF